MSMYESGHNAVTAPVTQQGIVVFNAQKDSYSIDQRVSATGDRRGEGGLNANAGQVADDNFHVLQHELALCHKLEYRGDVNRDSRPVVTSYNGFIASGADQKKFTFAGVAATRALHDQYNSVNNEEDCTVQIGGMCTVLNNGAGNIKFNDWVIWDYPALDEAGLPQQPVTPMYGCPGTKLQFRVQSLDTLLNTFESGDYEDLTPEWHAEVDDVDVTPCRVQAIMTEMRRNISVGTRQALKSELRGFAFGRAMNDARVGNQLDILLGGHCC
jgi:hypothetical protein